MKSLERQNTVIKYKEIYFCLYLTENEHYIAEDKINRACDSFGAKLLYYRKIKSGHVPMWREAKIVGNQTVVNRSINHLKNILRLILYKYSDNIF